MTEKKSSLKVKMELHARALLNNKEITKELTIQVVLICKK